ncbi:MAG: TlpA family protein disulfide reductase [Candidatus Kapaibacterium sp.]
MINRRIYPVLLMFIAFAVSACSLHEDPVETYRTAAEKRAEIESAKFGILDINPETNKIFTKKIYVKRNEQDTIHGIKARVEEEDGGIYVYADHKLWIVMPGEKQFMIVTHPKNAERFFQRYIGDIKAVMYIDEQSPAEIEVDSLWTWGGEAWMNGRRCNILNKKSHYSSVRDLDFKVTVYYDQENGVALKSDTDVWANGIRIQHNKTQVRNLMIDEMVCDALFEIESPRGYETKIYEETEKIEEETPQPERPEMLEKGDMAPDFTLNDGQGTTITLSELRGKPVILDFWGTWCVWCRVAMPKINKVYNDYKDDGVHVLGLSCREPDDADPVGYMNSKGMDYQPLINADETAEKYGVSGYPTLFVIDAEGKIIYAEAGYSDELDKILSDILDKELNKSAS